MNRPVQVAFDPSDEEAQFVEDRTERRQRNRRVVGQRGIDVRQRIASASTDIVVSLEISFGEPLCRLARPAGLGRSAGPITEVGPVAWTRAPVERRVNSSIVRRPEGAGRVQIGCRYRVAENPCRSIEVMGLRAICIALVPDAVLTVHTYAAGTSAAQGQRPAILNRSGRVGPGGCVRLLEVIAGSRVNLQPLSAMRRYSANVRLTLARMACRRRATHEVECRREERGVGS